MDDQRTDRDQIVGDLPLILLRQFASILGWHGLCKYQHRIPAGIYDGFPTETIITYYTTTHLKFFLQINEQPPGQSRSYQACIVAERYGLRPTEWQKFEILDWRTAMVEAGRLKPTLSRSILRHSASRRRFIREHRHLIFRRFVGRRTYRKLTEYDTFPTH